MASEGESKRENVLVLFDVDGTLTAARKVCMWRRADNRAGTHAVGPSPDRKARDAGVSRSVEEEGYHRHGWGL